MGRLVCPAENHIETIQRIGLRDIQCIDGRDERNYSENLSVCTPHS